MQTSTRAAVRGRLMLVYPRLETSTAKSLLLYHSKSVLCFYISSALILVYMQGPPSSTYLAASYACTMQTSTRAAACAGLILVYI